jgi:ankyrin repeat protein
LHWAAVHGADEIVECLLENGAKAFVADKKGYFPIDYAGLFNHPKTV